MEMVVRGCLGRSGWRKGSVGALDGDGDRAGAAPVVGEPGDKDVVLDDGGGGRALGFVVCLRASLRGDLAHVVCGESGHEQLAVDDRNARVGD